ncbi:MAG: CBS domain-containing protein, partial [Actinobacteria bacterium]
QLTASLEILEVKGQRVAVAPATVEEYVDSASVVAHHIVEDLGHRVAFAIVRMGDRTHVVGRSRIAEVDVGAVLTRLGGGGHPQAASAALKDVTPEEAAKALTEALEAELRPPVTAADIMSAPVRTVTPEQTMREAAEIMGRWGHGGLPVVEKGRIAGLVTRKDVDKAVRHRLDHAPVSGFMARDIVTVTPDMGLADLERLLAREGIGRVPVLEGRRVAGIVTRKDLLRAEHGEHYLDRAVPTARAESSRRFLQSVDSLLPADVRDALRAIGALAETRGLRAHVVGGFVRDMLLGRRNLDVDVVVEGDGVAFAEEAAARLGGRVKVHRRFGTAVLVLSKTLHVDITSARSEYYTRPGALPTVERSSLRQDLFRRDFTINAMAVELDPATFGQVTDPFGGLRDLERGVVRVLHSLSFVEDPTRVLRCARFAERYGFDVEPTTLQLAREAIEMRMLDEVSGARLREEMLDILDEDGCAKALERLDTLGAMALLVPEGCAPAAAVKTVGATERALKRLAPLMGRVPRRRTTLAVAVTHGATRAAAERWLRSLRFGREYGEGVLVAAERGGAALRSLSDRRGMRDSRLRAALHAMPAETLVYLWAVGGKPARERIERYLRVVAPVKAAVTGDDLLALGYRPSAAFAGILAQALADRLDGRAVGRTAELANLKRIAERTLGRPS